MSALLSPLTLGEMRLAHRAVMAPMTRSRSPGEEANALNVLYYHQRATPGGLIVTEGTVASRTGNGYAHVPGMWMPAQAKAWRPVTEAVHLRGGYVFAQLWHVGRVGHSRFMPDRGLPVGPVDAPAVSPTNTASRALTIPEIREIVREFGRSAQHAKEAGFDGIELHFAQGYLIDQFLNDGVNTRTDAYGGSVENRMRLLVEILETAMEVLGPQRVALRLSPHTQIWGIRDSDPTALFQQVFRRLGDYKPVYLHLTEPSEHPSGFRQAPPTADSKLDPLLRSLHKDIAVMRTGGFDRASADAMIASGRASMIGFGRPFLTCPDAVERMRTNRPITPLTGYKGVYGGGAELYTSYPTWYEQEASNWVAAQAAAKAKA